MTSRIAIGSACNHTACSDKPIYTVSTSKAWKNHCTRHHPDGEWRDYDLYVPKQGIEGDNREESNGEDYEEQDEEEEIIHQPVACDNKVLGSSSRQSIYYCCCCCRYGGQQKQQPSYGVSPHRCF